MLADGVNGVSVTGNTLENGATRALRLENFGTGPPDPTAVTFDRNSITGYAGPADTVQVDAYSGTLDATCNWWGDQTGPSGAGSGSGSSVSTGASFTPWLGSSDLNGDCSFPKPETLIDSH
ncbi:MAG: hypothetical protein ACRDVG_15115, partial [Jatrophihabitantaceae bacterium]